MAASVVCAAPVEVKFSTSKTVEKKIFRQSDVEELVEYLNRGDKTGKPNVVAMGRTVIIDFSLDGELYKLKSYNTSSPSNVIGSWDTDIKQWKWIFCPKELQGRKLFTNAILGYRILRFGELTKNDKRILDAKKAPLPLKKDK